MKGLLKPRFNFLKRQQGFSILEALVSVAILGLVGVGILTAMDTNFRAERTVDEQVTAKNLTTAYIEAIKALPFAVDYPTAGDNITVPPQYNVQVDIQCSNDAETYGACTGSETFQRIAISVYREGGNPVMRICTFRTDRNE